MYQAILRQFNKQGISQQNQITQHEIKKTLDNISSKNAGIYQFDNQVAHQIWNETQDNLVGAPVKLKDFINTMLKAQNILKQQVQHTQQQIRMQTDVTKKQQLLNDLFSYSQDHRTITMPFGLQQIRQSKQIRQSRNLQDNLSVRSNLFTTDIDQRESSTDLTVVFVLTIIWLAIDLVIMFQKHHFMNLIAIFLIIAAYALNFFERRYVLVILGWLAVSIAMDIAWMVINASPYWNGGAETQYSTKQNGFLKFIVFFVAVQIIIKFVLIGLLLKYRNVGENLRKKVKFGDTVFLLDGKKDPNNLIVRSLFDKSQQQKQFQL